MILFAGGDGALGLTGASSMKWGAGNFLVRTRNMFAARGFMVAVVDAPSDHKDGMNAVFRMSGARPRHRGGRGPSEEAGGRSGLARWDQHGHVFGRGRRHRGEKCIDGLVLTSTITRSKPDWKIARSHRDGVASMALPQIPVPALIVSHRKDGCKSHRRPMRRSSRTG